MPHYQRIRDLREDNDLTQRELAQILNMTQNQYWRYESGFSDIPTTMLIKLSKLYKVSVDYLLGLNDTK